MPAFCWSVATSRSSGSDLSLSRIFGAQALSSSRLASWIVYWNWVLAKRAADGHVLRRLQIDPEARNLRELRPEPRDDLEALTSRSSIGLERDEHAAVVLRRIADAGAEPHRHRGDRRIRHHDRARPAPAACTSRRTRRPAPASVVPNRMPVSCCGKNPLGMIDEQIDGRGDGREEGHQRREAVAQHEIDAALVAARQRHEAPSRSACRAARAAPRRGS